jgi:ubiquitin-activating enzyme E1
VTVHTPRDILTYKDLTSNYYAEEKDINKPFLDKTCKKLASLNDNVEVSTIKYINEKILSEYNVVIFCNYDVHDLFYWNKYCRKNNIKFIMLQSYGLTGSIFCDFGDEFIVDDIDGESKREGIISEISSNKFMTQDAHGLYTGDIISFSHDLIFEDRAIYTRDHEYLVKTINATEFNVREYKNKNLTSDQLKMEAFKSQCLNIKNQIPQNLCYTQRKLSTKLNFKSLEQSLKNPEFVIFDTFDFNMPRILHVFMQALSLWKIEKKSQFFNVYPSCQKDYQELYKLFDLEMMISCKDLKIDKSVKKIFDLLASTCNGRICGIDAIIGSMGAQEVIKAISNRFTPNKQFMHLEFLNILPDNYLESRKTDIDDYLPINSRYDGKIVIFGRKYQEILQNKKVFIVGAGAIGCEHIKNVSMMGISNITITDMDRIENSNLNRQFLFRKEDVGQSKSLTVAKKAKTLNPDVNVIAHENKIGRETLNVYNFKFFDNIDLILGALDNVEARKFVDNLCVHYEKPLLESGTLGLKGSVQSVIPYLTESYSSLQDPPEKNIPVCTLKLYPYKYEHIVQYARDLFEGYFNRIPSNLLKIRDNADVMIKMTPTDLGSVYDDIKKITSACQNFKYCINLAYKEWHKLFRDIPNQLVKKYPRDHVDENHNLFWSGNRIYPTSFEFNKKDLIDNIDLDFVIYFSQIWADMLKMPPNKRYSVDSREKYLKFIQRLEVPEEVICQDIFNENDQKIKKQKIHDSNFYNDKIKSLLEENQKFLSKVTNIEFEKDDDLNHHIDFITAVSNKRAEMYSMEKSDKLKTKGIAGKIIPAIATTTSLVSGLISMEIYKILFGEMIEGYNTLQRYRYGSFNLAAQSFGFSESNSPKTININDEPYNIWKKKKIDSNMTIKDLFEEEYGGSYYIKLVENDKLEVVNIEPEFLVNDQGIIYSSMMNDLADESDEMIDKTFYQIVKESQKDNSDLEGEYFFTLSFEEENDDDNVDLDKLNSDTMITLKVVI